MKIDIGEYKNSGNVFLKRNFNAGDDIDLLEMFHKDKQNLMNMEVIKHKVDLLRRCWIKQL